MGLMWFGGPRHTAERVVTLGTILVKLMDSLVNR